MLMIPAKDEVFNLKDETRVVCELGKRLVLTCEDEPSKTKPKKLNVSFRAIGNGMHTRDYQTFAYEQTLLQLTTPEQRLYSKILEGYDRNTGLSNVHLEGQTNTEKVVTSKAYAKLKERQLVRRVKKGQYLINPLAIIHFTLLDELIQLWESLV